MRPLSCPRLSLVLSGVALILTASPAGAACDPSAPDPAGCGTFGAPFTDPLLLDEVSADNCTTDAEGVVHCKPTAGALVHLEDGGFLYWNALEGTEDVELSIVAEFGTVSVNDQSRVLTLDANDVPSWSRPDNNDGGAPDENPGGVGPTLPPNNGADGALFCSDQVHLFDGRVLAAGGTDYYNELGTENVAELEDPFPLGAAELEGLKDARIYDPAANRWDLTDSMAYGRWYPTLVSLPTSDVFVASGVTKLIKPVYPETPINSGRNVTQTETFDVESETWSENGVLAEKSLPLFPRLHLLPNGHVYFNAGGQAFNPFGQGYDQTLWNLVSSYDPDTGEWTDLALAGYPMQLTPLGLDGIATELNPSNPDFVAGLLQSLAGTVLDDPAAFGEALGGELVALLSTLSGMDFSDPAVVQSVTGGGFRGSTFSVMLPLVPDAEGHYDVAEFLVAGGVESTIVNPSPGDYLATMNSRIDTVDVTSSPPAYSSRLTGPLGARRWYGSGTLLPDGQVLATSGADRDEVALPGAGFAVTVAELFDPVTETWSPAADQGNARTYHNSALLMQDGRVLVGGHAPINTAYASHIQLPGFSPQDGRDPSFQIYSPPYVFRSDRPEIVGVSSGAVANGGSVEVELELAAGTVFDHLILMRRTATTHLVDGDARGVVLVTSGDPQSGPVNASIPDTEVAPAGKYVLFANARASDGSLVPSKGASLSLLPEPGALAALASGAALLGWLARRRE